MATVDDLFLSLHRRIRPEDVAESIRQIVGDDLTRDEAQVLNRAARGALTRNSWGYSSMSTEFRCPVGMRNQIETARDLFSDVDAPSDGDCDRPVVIAPYLAAVSGKIAKRIGASDFKADRLNRACRVEVGLGEMSKRQYNKRFRLLARMERKLAILEREIRKFEYTLVSKSRLATKIGREEFVADRDSACFVAYLTSRANLRSVFTNGPQGRAYDEIADMMFARCRRNPGTNWWVIAHAHTDREVIARLSEEQKGRLLAIWYKLLCGIAELLREVWEKSRFNRSTMIVKRGDDSTTWNATAGAWNKAREGWIVVLHALDMDEVLDVMCPGKVLRLMAADVAAWHRLSGGGLEPDTAVWAELPAPWDVLNESKACTRADVESVCRTHGVDPIRKGWTAPRPERIVEAYRPTPELVHGVAVGHPGLAAILRKIGAFSGKKWKIPLS